MPPSESQGCGDAPTPIVQSARSRPRPKTSTSPLPSASPAGSPGRCAAMVEGGRPSAAARMGSVAQRPQMIADEQPHGSAAGCDQRSIARRGEVANDLTAGSRSSALTASRQTICALPPLERSWVARRACG